MNLLVKRYPHFILFLLALSPLLYSSPSIAAEKTIGVIMTVDTPYYKKIHTSFLQGLSSEGYGKEKVQLILQSPSPSPMSWINAAKKLVAFDADIIVTYGLPPTIVVMNETSRIPVVFAGVYDPQAFGLPDKNATGVSAKVPLSDLLKNLKDISNFSSLGIVFSKTFGSLNKDAVLQAKEIKQLKEALEFSPIIVNLKKTADLSRIAGIDALFLTTSCAARPCINTVIDNARKGSTATASIIGGGEQSGVVLTMNANPQEQGREAARLVSQIMKGADPSSFPIVNPKEIDLIINLKEAKHLGLTVSSDLLATATTVIR